MVLMSDSTVYNVSTNTFITGKDGTKVSNVDNIIYAWSIGNLIPFVYLEIENNTYITNNNIIASSPFSENKLIREIYFLFVDNQISSEKIIYENDNTVMIKNFSIHTLIDIDCQHIETNIIDNILEIYLLKNDNIILYHFDTATNTFVVKKIYSTNNNIYKNVRNYLIGLNGSLHRVDICTNYEQTTITEIKTAHKICDIMITNNILLTTHDGEILKYDRKNNVIRSLGSRGSFCLHYNSTKSAKI